MRTNTLCLKSLWTFSVTIHSAQIIFAVLPVCCHSPCNQQISSDFPSWLGHLTPRTHLLSHLSFPNHPVLTPTLTIPASHSLISSQCLTAILLHSLARSLRHSRSAHHCVLAILLPVLFPYLPAWQPANHYYHQPPLINISELLGLPGLCLHLCLLPCTKYDTDHKFFITLTTCCQCLNIIFGKQKCCLWKLYWHFQYQHIATCQICNITNNT